MLQILPFISIGVNRLCISIVFVLNKTLTKKIKYLYLPAYHVIINQHQRNREHANVILNYSNIYLKISGVIKANIFGDKV